MLFVLFLLIIFPREFFEYNFFNKNIIYNFLNPITDPFAASSYNDTLRHGPGNSRTSEPASLHFIDPSRIHCVIQTINSLNFIRELMYESW